MPTSNRALLRFKSTLPFHLENRLHNKYGFRIHSRCVGSFIVFAKDVEPVSKKKTDNVVLIDGVLSEELEAKLIKECNKVLDWYANPEHHAASIRIRLKNLAMTKPMFERVFIEGWTDRNVPFGSNRAKE